jgi:hypothetical protein
VPAGARLRLGVRPEHLRLQRADADDLAWPGHLLLLEPLGAETLATVRVGQAEVIARVPASFEAAPGTPLQLHVQPGQLHLFDADSGQAGMPRRPVPDPIPANRHPPSRKLRQTMTQLTRRAVAVLACTAAVLWSQPDTAVAQTAGADHAARVLRRPEPAA